MALSKLRSLAIEPVTFSESGGIRYLHFGSDLIQGAMRLNDPDEIYLDYNQQMMAWLLFLETRPGLQVAQLGLGTGALAKFQYRYCPAVKTTVIELNPAVIVAARTMFYLPDDDRRLQVRQSDALEFVLTATNAKQYDALQVDLYDVAAEGPVLSSLEFYQGCYGVLRSPGVMTVNLFSQHKSFKRNLKNICKAFHDRVLLFPESHDCNAVAIAFKGPHIYTEWKNIKKRAQLIQKQTGLTTASWAQGLRNANARQELALEI
jgi:spermidine synthase